MKLTKEKIEQYNKRINSGRVSINVSIAIWAVLFLVSWAAPNYLSTQVIMASSIIMASTLVTMCVMCMDRLTLRINEIVHGEDESV